MPRIKKPAAIAIASGTVKAHPARARTDLVASGAIGPPPDYLDEVEREVWSELVGAAPSGVLKAADRTALAVATKMTARMRAGADISAATCNALTSLLTKLGLTPAGRLALSVPASRQSAAEAAAGDAKGKPKISGLAAFRR